MKWLTAVLGVAVVVLGFLLWKTPGPPSDIPVLISRNDSLKIVLKQKDSVDQVRSLSVAFHDSVVARKIDSLENIANARHDSLKTAKNRLQVLTDRVSDLIGQTGDPVLKAAYDSVKTALDSSYVLVGAAYGSQNEVINSLAAQVKYKDSLYQVDEKEIKDLKLIGSACTLNFDAQTKDVQALQKQIKKQNIWGKIWTGVAALGGFVIGHGIK